MTTAADENRLERRLAQADSAAGISFAALPKTGPAPVDAVYVHVPFCSTKCHYCDFYSIAGHLDEVDAYLEALQREVALQVRHFGLPRPETIFIGGGTPTLLDPAQLERLMAILHESVDMTVLREFTVEANPNTFDAPRARVLKAAGVNRISCGAQSFVKSELQTLQRDHDPENVPLAFEIARAAGIENLNVDLIFGIPGQTLESWVYSLDRALALAGGGPDHLSCYSLIYESNTAMTARLNRGEFTPIDEDLELALFEHVYRRLRDAGYQRYEVSNYARPGRECRHNLHYWKGGQWLAWGPSAAAHVAGWRWKNVTNLTHYLAALQEKDPQVPATQMERLSTRRRAGELAVFWLRLAEGLNYAEFHRIAGLDARPVLERVLKNYAELGFVSLTPTAARLEEKAVVVSNRILTDVVDAF